MFQSALLKPAVMWERHRNPLSGWTRVALGLCLPFVVWSHDWLLITLFLIALVTNPYWFPPIKPGNKNLDIMTRLVDAERWWLTRYASRLDIALLFVPALALAIPMLYFLWIHHLFWGAFFFLTIAAYKTLFSLRVLELAGEAAQKPEPSETETIETKETKAAKKPKKSKA